MKDIHGIKRKHCIHIDCSTLNTRCPEYLYDEKDSYNLGCRYCGHLPRYHSVLEENKSYSQELVGTSKELIKEQSAPSVSSTSSSPSLAIVSAPSSPAVSLTMMEQNQDIQLSPRTLLPQHFSKFVQPLLQGQPLDECIKRKMTGTLMKEIIAHLDTNNLICGSFMNNKRDYLKLGDELISNYPHCSLFDFSGKRSTRHPFQLCLAKISSRRRQAKYRRARAAETGLPEASTAKKRKVLRDAFEPAAYSYDAWQAPTSPLHSSSPPVSPPPPLHWDPISQQLCRLNWKIAHLTRKVDLLLQQHRHCHLKQDRTRKHDYSRYRTEVEQMTKYSCSDSKTTERLPKKKELQLTNRISMKHSRGLISDSKAGGVTTPTIKKERIFQEEYSDFAHFSPSQDDFSDSEWEGKWEFEEDNVGKQVDVFVTEGIQDIIGGRESRLKIKNT